MSRAERRCLVAILIVAGILRIYPIWFGLPYVQARPDETTALGHAVGVLRSGPDPGFFNWPSLTFYCFAAAIHLSNLVRGIAGAAPAESFADVALIGRFVVALAGTLTVLLLFRLGQLSGGSRVGLLAASFLAVSVLHVRESHFAMTDVFATLLSVGALISLLQASRAAEQVNGPPGDATRLCAVAGLLAGLATSTKYSLAVVAIGMVVLQFSWVVRTASWSRARTWVPLAAFATAMAVGFVVGTPYAVLDFAKFSDDVQFEARHLAVGHGGPDLARGWLYHVLRSLPYGAGPGAIAAALAGVGPFVRRHPREAAVLLSFAGLFYISIGSGQTVFFRYVLPIVPVVCLVAGVGVASTSDWISRRWRLSSALALAMVTLVTIGPGLVQSARLDLVLARTDTRVLAASWLGPQLKPGDSVYDSGSDYTRLELGETAAARWTWDAQRAAFVEGTAPAWLVLHESPLEHYAAAPGAVRGPAGRACNLAFQVRATTASVVASDYDQQDAFFVPMRRFSGVHRPGPTIRIYRCQ